MMKDQVALVSIFLIAMSFALLKIYDTYHKRDLTMEMAIDPVDHLSNAYYLITHDNFNQSIKELDEGISAMKIIKNYSDSSAKEHMRIAIRDLELVEREIKSDSLSVNDLNRAFFNALNSIAFANLKISEKKLDKGQHYRAMNMLNASFTEMVSSLKFVKGDMKAEEEQVIADVRKILSKLKDSDFKYKFDYDSINHELEQLIEE